MTVNCTRKTSVIEKIRITDICQLRKRQIIHKKIYSSIRVRHNRGCWKEPDITEIMINGPNNIFVEKRTYKQKIDEKV